MILNLASLNFDLVAFHLVASLSFVLNLVDLTSYH
jgi:hypothetical protein